MTEKERGLRLFDAPRARKRDPDTSRQAAESMARGAAQHRARILTHLRTVANATKDEIAAAIGLDDVRVARRTSELRDARLIVDSGERRPSKSGRPCIAWRAR